MQHPDCRVNATDRWGRTALHEATEAGRADVVKVLVSQAHCDISIADSHGDTAAVAVREKRHPEIAALIEAYYDLSVM